MTTTKDIEYSLDEPIIAYVSRADRRKLIVMLDIMDRFITEDGAIIDGQRPWMHFRVLEDRDAFQNTAIS